MVRAFEWVCFADGQAAGITTTIHDTPKRSSSMPKRGEKNVLPSGILTLPPLLSPLNARSASASLLTWIESVTPPNGVLSAQSPSDAMTSLSPILKHACMTLLSQFGGSLSGGGGFSL